MIILIISYILGSIPTGLIISKKYYYTDIRDIGSKNIGATNMMRVLGKKPAIITLGIDILKGIVAVLIAKIFGSTMIQSFAAIFVVIGHIYPVWLNFRGGKGIATSLGAFIVLSPSTALFAAVIWGAVFYRTRISSAAAITAIICTPVFSLFVNTIIITLAILSIALFSLYNHKENIKRLFDNMEKKI